MRLFSKYFPYERRDRMVQTLCNLKSKANNNNEIILVEGSFAHFEN